MHGGTTHAKFCIAESKGKSSCLCVSCLVLCGRGRQDFQNGDKMDDVAPLTQSLYFGN